jgi:heat shock protein HspQ
MTKKNPMVRILTRLDKECRPIDHRLFLVLANVILDKLGVKQYLADSGVFVCMNQQFAKYNLGQIVRHRKHPFRGVVFDVDPEFANTEEWYESIPEDSRPAKEQPFYHLLAENDHSFYVAYVSEQNLVADYSGEPVEHPDIPDMFGPFQDGQYPLHFQFN